jgi:hypothetical protein
MEVDIKAYQDHLGAKTIRNAAVERYATAFLLALLMQQSQLSWRH